MRFNTRRAKLQRSVGVTVGAAAALFILGLVLQARADAERQLLDAAPMRPATQLEPVVVPAPVVVPELVVTPPPTPEARPPGQR